MTRSWTPEELALLEHGAELEISAPLGDGGSGRWTPIWVVVVDDRAFVRTWQRRTTGWYGRAVAAGRAAVALGGATVSIEVAAVGDDDADAIDAAYRAKYSGAGARSVVTAEARLSTLRLDPAE